MYKRSYQNEKPSLKEAENKGTSLAKMISALRKRRANECFTVINRGRLWYDRLTIEQYSELELWYQAWLDVTKTLKVPDEPTWLNDKLEAEDIY